MFFLNLITNKNKTNTKGNGMFFITGMSTFTWILLAYVGLHMGQDYFDFLKGIDLNTIIFTYHMKGGNDFIIRVRELFLIIGSLALFIEVAKAATTNKFNGAETLLSFVVSIVFIVLFFMAPWAQNATFLVLSLMSFIDATGGFIIEVNAAKRDIGIS